MSRKSQTMKNLIARGFIPIERLSKHQKRKIKHCISSFDAATIFLRTDVFKEYQTSKGHKITLFKEMTTQDMLVYNANWTDAPLYQGEGVVQ